MDKMVLVDRKGFISKITEQEAIEKGYKVIPDDTPLVFYYSSYAVEEGEDPSSFDYGIVTESTYDDMDHGCYSCQFVDSYEEARQLEDEMHERLEA